MIPYEERLCRTCKYGKESEYQKPCVVYRNDCQLYEPIEEMTRVEQTIANLKKLKSFHNGSYGADIDLAIKALEQQPSEDAVSRELVRKEFYNWVMYKKTPNDFLYVLGGLPSVTPQQRTGHWRWELASNGWANHICSKCGFKENTDIHVKLNWRYCPNCGAKMVESEE